MSLRGAKISLAVLRPEDLYFMMKGGSQQIMGGPDDGVVIFGVIGLGIFGRGL
jgi:hypothetical protein